MDPAAILRVLELSLVLANKVYDDTPQEIRAQNIERWYKFWDDMGEFFRTGRIPQ